MQSICNLIISILPVNNFAFLNYPVHVKIFRIVPKLLVTAGLSNSGLNCVTHCTSLCLYRF